MSCFRSTYVCARSGLFFEIFRTRNKILIFPVSRINPPILNIYKSFNYENPQIVSGHIPALHPLFIM